MASGGDSCSDDPFTVVLFFDALFEFAGRIFNHESFYYGFAVVVFVAGFSGGVGGVGGVDGVVPCFLPVVVAFDVSWYEDVVVEFDAEVEWGVGVWFCWVGVVPAFGVCVS